MPRSVPSPERSALLRLIDANRNRALEALRVIEDQVRFGLCGEARESAQLKELRHVVQRALAPLAAEALRWRDAAGDVGNPSARADTRPREGSRDVLGANLARAQEALRVLEEHVKLLAPASAVPLSQARYDLYGLAQRLLAGPPSLELRRVYAIVGSGPQRPPLSAQVEALLAGGVRLIQVREKGRSDRELLAVGRALVRRCEAHDALLIWNDRPDLAQLCGAAGVHLGRDDLPLREARALLGSDRHLGASVHDAAELAAALAEGPSYLGFGTLFASPTKPELGAQGLSALRALAASSPLRIYGIGGVTRANAARVIEAGAHGVAVASDLVEAPDIAAAAAELIALVEAAGQAVATAAGQAALSGVGS